MRSRAAWCVAEETRPGQFIILSEHQTIKQARGTLPHHKAGGATNPIIIKRTTTWEEVP